MGDNNDKSSYASAASTQTLWMFDIRPHVNYFERPDRSALGAATKSIFPSDPALGFTEMRGRMAGCFKVAATTQPIADHIVIKRKKKGSAGGFEDVDVPLRPFSLTGGARREGLLVTIVEADVGPARGGCRADQTASRQIVGSEQFK